MGSRIADIGSDHALIPSYLALRQRISYAVAGEVRIGPLQSAQKQVAAFGLQHVVDVRLGNGLEVIAPGEVDTVIIAGMGGSLIASILTEGRDRLEGVQQLILQPNVAEADVRRWLLHNGWYLQDEMILNEDGYIYEILVAIPESPGQPRLYEELSLKCGIRLDQSRQLLMGPHLLRNPNTVWMEKWERELNKLERIHQQLKQSSTDSGKQKTAEVSHEIKQISEVLQCLQKAKPSCR